MTTTQPRHELDEFYRELELLVRARVPLPTGLAGVADACGDRHLRQTLETVSADVARGVPLSQALASHRKQFPPFHVALVRCGERGGVLAEVLHDVASACTWATRLGTGLKEAAAYPMMTSAFAVTLLLVLLRFYLPGFGDDIQALLEQPLPAYSAALFALANGVVALWPVILPLYIAILITIAWFFSDRRPARSALQRLMRHLPGSAAVMATLDMARVAGVWSILMRRGVPLDTILEIVSDSAQNRFLKKKLDGLREQCAAGISLQQAAAAADLPAPLSLTLQHTREQDLAAELNAMRDHLTARADADARRLGMLWQIAAFTVMALVSAVVIISMFMPMIELYGVMAE